jgi:predicted metal-binding membrane protein
MSTMMVTTSPLLGGVLLVAAGVFQWTRLKAACLVHCRSPLSFIVTSWREGRGGAFRMGLHHGLYCLGCCWLLMALLFVAGVMNLLWVAAIAAAVLVEKVIPRGDILSRLAGVALVAAGLLVVARAFAS